MEAGEEDVDDDSWLESSPSLLPLQPPSLAAFQDDESGVFGNEWDEVDLAAPQSSSKALARAPSFALPSTSPSQNTLLFLRDLRAMLNIVQQNKLRKQQAKKGAKARRAGGTERKPRPLSTSWRRIYSAPLVSPRVAPRSKAAPRKPPPSPTPPSTEARSVSEALTATRGRLAEDGRIKAGADGGLSGGESEAGGLLSPWSATEGEDEEGSDDGTDNMAQLRASVGASPVRVPVESDRVAVEGNAEGEGEGARATAGPPSPISVWFFGDQDDGDDPASKPTPAFPTVSALRPGSPFLLSLDQRHSMRRSAAEHRALMRPWTHS